MNSNQKTFLIVGLLSLLGACLGTIAFKFAGALLFAGIGEAIGVFSPGVLLAIMAATVFNINTIIFAGFYTMYVMSRGLTVQNTMLWVGISLLFNIVFAGISGGLSVIGLVLMAIQSFSLCFGAHFTVSFFRSR
jgi:hypothetical protein